MGLLTHLDLCFCRVQLRAFLADHTSTQDSPALHIVVASVSELLGWTSALATDDHVRVYPYWGEKADRDQVLYLLHTEYYRRQRSRAYVLVTSFDVFAADVASLGVVQWQTTVIDVPESVWDQEQLNAVWMPLLSLRTRHRVLVAHAAFQIDTRRTLQFLLPGLFSSRRKLLVRSHCEERASASVSTDSIYVWDGCLVMTEQAWNCAAFDVDMIHRMCRVIESFVLVTERHALQAFLAASTQYSIAKSDQELTTLSRLEKSGLVRRGVSSFLKNERELKLRELFVSAKVKAGPSSSAKVRRGNSPVCVGRVCVWLTTMSWLADLQVKARRASQDLTAPVVAHKVSAPTFLGGHESVRSTVRPYSHQCQPFLVLQKKDADAALSLQKREADAASASRKRLGRCGKCTGCLAGDCMTCGHCQDMKKYGGPGLRKQSCKNRKCINPRRWGMAVRKRKRAKTARKVEPGHDKSEGDDDASEKYESESDDHDDGATSYYSQDSDHDSTFETSVSHDAGYSHSDSDTHESARTPERDTSEHLPDGDGDNTKETRKRVSRCGKCAGCMASDCMECIHCLDKKKYGGPGLRKQSCKHRKCMAPKLVRLNQAKEDEGPLDDKSYSHSSSLPARQEFLDGGNAETLNGAVLYRMNVHIRKRAERILSVVQECEVFIDRHLEFSCDRCVARFSSRTLLALHERVEHATGDVRLESLETEASRLLAHPVPQLGFIRAQLREKQIPSHASPRAYAKLEVRLVFVDCWWRCVCVWVASGCLLSPGCLASVLNELLLLRAVVGRVNRGRQDGSTLCFSRVWCWAASGLAGASCTRASDSTRRKDLRAATSTVTLETTRLLLSDTR